MRWFAAPLALAVVFLTLPVLAIFVDSPPSELIAALGEPGALDALWLSLQTSGTRAGDHRAGRDARRLPAGHARASAAARW